MRTDAWLKVGLAAMIAALALTDGGRGARAQTILPMSNYYVRLIRAGEKNVLPGVGVDVWGLRTDLHLDPGFDPNRKDIDIFITTPAECPGCGGSAGGAFPDPGELHANPLHVQQLLPRRGGIWSMWLHAPDNGSCRVSLTPRETKWMFRARCRGAGILPKFLDTLAFQASLRIGDVTFITPAKEFKQVRKTIRRAS
jgi:hypothetical protein